MNPNEPQNQLAEGKGRQPGVLTPLNLFLIAVCVVQFVLIGFIFSHRSRGQVASPPAKPASSADVYADDNPGPWGNLKYARITLEPPDEFIPLKGDFFGPPKWYFEGYTSSSLKEFLSRCDLTPEQLEALTDAKTWAETTNGIVVMPDSDVVLNLAESSRQKIYAVLGQNPQNTQELWPFKARVKDLNDWFGNIGLDDGTMSLLKKLVYHRGEYLCFSDVAVIYPRIPMEDRRRLMKEFARTDSLLMKLQINPGSNVKALAGYWSRGGRNKSIEALLNSMTNTPGGMTIDIAHLLPAFARKYIYTFPAPPTDSADEWPNCNWSAFNFFNDPPDDRFYDFDFCGATLETDYVKTKQATFGDLIVFYRPDGYPIHVVVYIADDVVFTKNGSSPFHPWTLMKWDDLITDYTLDYSPGYIIFHHKAPEE